MSLKSDMAEALDELFTAEEFGEQVIYNGQPIQAIVDLGENPDDQGGAGRGGSVVDRAVLEVRVADVAAPAYRDTVVINSVTWEVRRVMASDFHGHRLELYRNERPKPRMS